MKKYTTLENIKKTFMEYNEENAVNYGLPSTTPQISAIIVYKQSNFTKEYSEHDRSYRITNRSGKAFFSHTFSTSIYGDCLDGDDLGVRLDRYDWDIEYCYFE